VTLPEVVTGELTGKFGEISLFDQHADFELGSASNSSSTSPWTVIFEPATQPSHVNSPLRERFTRGPRNVSRAHKKAPTTRRAGKEPVPEYDSDSDEGPIRRTREGGGSEWEPIKILLEEDENSNKMNTASNTRFRLTTQIGQAHAATGVPLDLGTNTHPSDPRTQRNTKPRVYRPTPVRLVSTTGQTGPYW
jgi:hypothetical protein